MIGIKVKTSKYNANDYIGEIIDAVIVSEPFVLDGYRYVYVKIDDSDVFHPRRVSTNLRFAE